MTSRRPLLRMLHRVQRAAVQPVGEWIVHQPVRDAEQSRIVHVLEPVAFQRAQIVGVAQFVAQFLEDLPVSLACGGAVLDADMHIQIGLHAIVVQQRVVDVEQEDDVVHHCAVSLAGSGLRQGPSPPMSATASSGPQVPAWYG